MNIYERGGHDHFFVFDKDDMIIYCGVNRIVVYF